MCMLSDHSCHVEQIEVNQSSDYDHRPPSFLVFFFFFLFVVAYIDDIHSFSLTSTSSAYAHIYRHQIVVSKKKKS
jgi:hypothetical protein